ncbi:hypothetical protein DFH08DRAFT_115685 [Mycena albidolilacea]|uniref:Secreted protein n=1 Tax=Mycena albidolilacea TaxID=1033008 RepID=A0AAD7A6S2_9AGAR|nr:hypothetical protein DFH08DRAFT_115685 [Mycena albidolilacea]
MYVVFLCLLHARTNASSDARYNHGRHPTQWSDCFGDRVGAKCTMNRVFGMASLRRVPEPTDASTNPFDLSDNKPNVLDIPPRSPGVSCTSGRRPLVLIQHTLHRGGSVTFYTYIRLHFCFSCFMHVIHKLYVPVTHCPGDGLWLHTSI